MGRHMNTVEQTEIWDRYEAGQTFTEIAASVGRQSADPQRRGRRPRRGLHRSVGVHLDELIVRVVPRCTRP